MKYKRLYYKPQQFFEARKKMREIQMDPWTRNVSITLYPHRIILEWYKLPPNARNYLVKNRKRR